MEEINLEDGYPTVDAAIRYLQDAISILKNQGNACLYIIHGYGSSGVGGKIKIKVRQYLNAQIRYGVVKKVYNGEDFIKMKSETKELRKKYKRLEQLVLHPNEGVTVIVIK